MATSDLDPIFLKGLKLLQSRSKDSKDQLKQLYDEVAAQRKAEILAKRLSDGFEITDSRLLKTVIKKEYGESERKKEFDKLKQDIAELSQDVPLKKIKLESSASSSSSGSPRPSESKDRAERYVGDKIKSEVKVEKPRERLREIEEDIFFGPTVSNTSRVKEREREEREKTRQRDKDTREKKETMVPVMAARASMDDSGSETEVSGDEMVEGDSNDQDDNIDDMQLEFLGSLSCVVCKSLSVMSNNQLLECQECHSLYHQDCHKPPVTDYVNDPRYVWYCSTCTKNMKKIVIKNQKKPVKPAVAVTSRDSPVFKPAKPEPPVVLQPFKRIEPPKLSVAKESATGGTVAGSAPARGLAGLAANLNSRSATSAFTSPPDSLRVKSESSSVSRASPSSSSVRPDSVKVSSECKTSTVSPGWGSVSRVAPATSGKGDGLKTTLKTSLSSSSLTSSKTVPPLSVSSSAANSSSGKMSQSTMMSADKRLQIMKKKAAAKMVEKRTR